MESLTAKLKLKLGLLMRDYCIKLYMFSVAATPCVNSAATAVSKRIWETYEAYWQCHNEEKCAQTVTE